MRPAPPIRIVAVSGVLLLCGCSAIANLNAAATPLQIYELRAPEFAVEARRRAVELVVEEPVASGALATDRIMIRPDAFQAQYLPGARWPDPAPAMLQTLMLRTLLNAGALESVGRRPISTLGDYALLSELTDFQAEVQEDGQVLVRVSLIARIARERDARVIATQRFETSSVVSTERTNDIVAGFDDAAGRLVSEVAAWTLARLGG